MLGERAGQIVRMAEIAVADTAVEIAPARPGRSVIVIQNVGDGAIRIGGPTGAAAATGLFISAGDTAAVPPTPGGVVTFEEPGCPSHAFFAIREGATNSTVSVMEVV